MTQIILLTCTIIRCSVHLATALSQRTCAASIIARISPFDQQTRFSCHIQLARSAKLRLLGTPSNQHILTRLVFHTPGTRKWRWEKTFRTISFPPNVHDSDATPKRLSTALMQRLIHDWGSCASFDFHEETHLTVQVL